MAAEDGGKYPNCFVLFRHVDARHRSAWLRRIARGIQDEEDVAENMHEDDVRSIIEGVLVTAASGDWEKEHLLHLLKNDGSEEGMAAMIPRIMKFIREKANSGVGLAANKSRCASAAVKKDPVAPPSMWWRAVEMTRLRAPGTAAYRSFQAHRFSKAA